MDKLIEIINNYVEIDGEITAASDFRKDLGFSSFDIVCMIEEIEEKYGKKLKPADFVTYKTVGEMVDFLAE